MNLGNLDLSKFQEFGDNLLPPGTYNVVVSNAEVKQRPSNGENYLSLWYKIEGPTHAGQIVFDSLSLWSAEPKFQSIAYSKLKSIRNSLGLNGNIAGDTDELLGRKMTIKVGVREKDGRQYQNINAYKKADAAVPASAPTAAPMPGAAASAATPW